MDSEADISTALRDITDSLALIHQTLCATDGKRKEIPPADTPIYAPIARMSKLYCMSRDKLERILEVPVKEGKIRVLRPTDNNGRIGNKSYHLKDFEKHFASLQE